MPDEVEVTDLRPSKEVKDFHPFKPILDRLLLRRLAAKEDASGFEIPSKFREPEARGEVMTVGDGVTLGGAWHAMTEFVNVGDHVLFGEHTVEKIIIDGEEFDIARLQDIRGVRRLKRPCNHQWVETQKVGSIVFRVCLNCNERGVDESNV